MSKEDEMILTLSRGEVFSEGGWQGVRGVEVARRIVTLASEKGQFLKRGDVENDSQVQQIIPYIIYENNGKYFLMRRKGEHDETRLAGKWSVGIGGHLREDDLKENGDDIIAWSRRELEEEVDVEGDYQLKICGVINDDGDDVGRVHLGVIILAQGKTDKITIRDEHKEAVFITRDEANRYRNEMESWTVLVFDNLDKLRADAN